MTMAKPITALKRALFADSTARMLPPAVMYWKPESMIKKAATTLDMSAPALSWASKVRTIGSVSTGAGDPPFVGARAAWLALPQSDSEDQSPGGGVSSACPERDHRVTNGRLSVSNPPLSGRGVSERCREA